VASLCADRTVGSCIRGNGASCPSEDQLKAEKDLTRRAIPWGWLLCAYFLGLAVVGYWPTPVDEPARDTLAVFIDWLHRYGAPQWFSYKWLEAGANVLLFVPMGALCVASFPLNTWLQNVAIGVMVSASMELGQGSRGSKGAGPNAAIAEPV
jgi:hypothetical protein